MNDPWKILQLAAIEALDPLWNELAKEGKESAVLAPLARYSNAAAWLTASLDMSNDFITRKMGAALAGWIDDPKHAALLSKMLDRERALFGEDSSNANSVGEDIMFSATRWTQSQHPEVREAGIHLLARMIQDALEGTSWNTVHWAVANLHRVTAKHEVLQFLAGVTDTQIEGQRFFQNAVRALRQNDTATLERFVTAPAELYSLSPDDAHYSVFDSLWRAAAAAEASLA